MCDATGRARHGRRVRPRRRDRGYGRRPPDRLGIARCDPGRCGGALGLSRRPGALMMLSVEAIEAGYGAARVLQGVDFDLAEGEALALLGRNGMGKTTTVRALFGLLPLKAGRIVFDGASLGGRPPYAIAQAGLGRGAGGRLPRSSVSSRASLSSAANTATSSPAESSKCSLSGAR